MPGSTPGDSTYMKGLPVIAWLGRPPPEELGRQLGAVASIRMGWQVGARVAACWGDSQPTLLDALPVGADRPPVLVACVDALPPELRRRWESAGADHIVSINALPTAISEWLTGSRREEHTDDPPTFNPAAPPRPDDLGPALSMFKAPAYGDPDDPFPPLRLDVLASQGSDEIRRYVLSLDRYLERRDEVIRLMGEDGLTRFLELAHLREQVPASVGGRQRLDPYGRGRQAAPPDWKLIVRRLQPRTRQIEVSEGRMYAVGTDGVVLVTVFAAAPCQRLLVDLPYDAISNVQFIYEARWQRRIAARRWHVGTLLVEMRRRPLDGRGG
ncbi:MAG: hypothetical protein GXP62_08870 [Oligoflexia bacterium]|nr:hypothetical protein [Oligoflexia bacterium]